MTGIPAPCWATTYQTVLPPPTFFTECTRWFLVLYAKIELVFKYFTRSNLGVAIGTIVAIYLMVILGGVIKRNHDLQVQINGLNNQITQLENQKAQLSYEISYYKTNAYQEEQARAKLGLASPGESLILLPKDKSASTPASKSVTKPPKSHIAQWFEFLFGS